MAVTTTTPEHMAERCPVELSALFMQSPIVTHDMLLNLCQWLTRRGIDPDHVSTVLCTLPDDQDPHCYVVTIAHDEAGHVRTATAADGTRSTVYNLKRITLAPPSAMDADLIVWHAVEARLLSLRAHFDQRPTITVEHHVIASTER